MVRKEIQDVFCQYFAEDGKLQELVIDITCSG